MKKILVLTAILATAFTTLSKAEEASEPIGVSVGASYVSSYLFRGIDFYSGEGAFLPSISYNVMGSGLILGVALEHSEDCLFEGKGKDAVGHSLNSVDVGAGYTVETSSVNIGLNVWYWDYYNSEDELGSDASFITSNITATANVFLSPFAAFTYDYYLDDEFADTVNQDYYLQLGLGKEFEVTKDAKVKLGVVGGYYNYKSAVKDAKGISDITATAGTTIAAGAVTYTSSLNYAYIPKGDFRDLSPENHHKFYATFGAAYSF